MEKKKARKIQKQISSLPRNRVSEEFKDIEEAYNEDIAIMLQDYLRNSLLGVLNDSEVPE